jgi:hypothetical protein
MSVAVHKPTVLEFPAGARVAMTCQDNLAFMRPIADESVQLIVTSPPYNIVDIAWESVRQLQIGTLRTRSMEKPVYDPSKPNGGQV